MPRRSRPRRSDSPRLPANLATQVATDRVSSSSLPRKHARGTRSTWRCLLSAVSRSAVAAREARTRRKGPAHERQGHATRPARRYQKGGCQPPSAAPRAPWRAPQSRSQATTSPARPTPVCRRPRARYRMCESARVFACVQCRAHGHRLHVHQLPWPFPIALLKPPSHRSECARADTGRHSPVASAHTYPCA